MGSWLIVHSCILNQSRNAIKVIPLNYNHLIGYIDIPLRRGCRAGSDWEKISRFAVSSWNQTAPGPHVKACFTVYFRMPCFPSRPSWSGYPPVTLLLSPVCGGKKLWRQLGVYLQEKQTTGALLGLSLNCSNTRLHSASSWPQLQLDLPTVCYVSPAPPPQMNNESLILQAETGPDGSAGLSFSIKWQDSKSAKESSVSTGARKQEQSTI